MTSSHCAEANAEEPGALMCWFGAWLGTERDRRNHLIYRCWSILFAVSLVASVWMLKAGFANGAARWAIAALPVALWLPWVLAYLRLLHEADELVRRIQLEAAMAGFLAGFSGGIGYTDLAAAGLLRLDAATAVPLMVAVIALGYAVGQARASKRYR